MKTLVLANQKGGVGKSAVATLMSHYFAQHGQRVLAIDFDHQGNFSGSMRRSSRVQHAGITADRLLTESVSVMPSADLVIVPGDTPLSMLELQSTNHTPFARNLRHFLAVMDKQFDVCVIDTNPGPDIRVISALASADFVLSPIQLNQEAMEGVHERSSASAVVEFMLVSRGEQHDIDVANREQDDAPAMPEGDDQLPELPVRFRSTTGVRRKREDPHRALHRVAEPKEARVIWCIARQFALHDVFLEALDVLLERDGRNNSKPTVHPAARLFLAAAASRMRCCPALARCAMPAKKSSAVNRPAPLSALRNASFARTTAAFCWARNSASRQTAPSMNCVSDSPSRSTASRLAFVSGATRMGGRVAERLIERMYSICITSTSQAREFPPASSAYRVIARIAARRRGISAARAPSAGLVRVRPAASWRRFLDGTHRLWVGSEPSRLTEAVSGVELLCSREACGR